MAQISFRMPDIGEGIAEAEIVAWHVKVGDRVEEDAPLADVMTDKATVVVESPFQGRIAALGGAEGEMLAIGATLVMIEVTDDARDDDDDAGVRHETPDVPKDDAPPHEAGEGLEQAVPHTHSHAAPEPASEEKQAPVSMRVLASPAVRARIRDLGIDIAHIRPSRDGRIRHADLDAYLAYNGAQGYAVGETRADEQVKVIGLRRRIAENMAASKRHIPHFSYVEEIEVTKLEAMRADLNASRGDRPKLTMLPFLIVAMCKALPEFPVINARYDDEAGVVTRHGAVHLGLATQTEAGLMVPVIRDAQKKNIWQLASEIARLADAVRTGKARPEELSGSTVTVTSLGALGGIATTPVINRPEVAIIGPNRIIERPVFSAGSDHIRRALLMNLSISCDHRVVDGWEAASFVQAVRVLLETPVLLFAD